MKNVTISLNDELERKLRARAAKAGKSMSRFIAETLEERTVAKPIAHKASNLQLEAIERFLAGPRWDVLTDGRMPTSEERNER
ncbi:hypothetical protein [Brucella sp. IR073]|uniref:hypothetical protein n=1 Tax=unclassified Brucella TaxID=2632610 RepID=UPI003B97F97A